MNNTKKVLKYGECFGKDFLVDGTLVNPDWRIHEHRYRLLRDLFDQSNRDDPPYQVSLRISYLDLCYSTQLHWHSRYFDLNEGLYNGVARRLSQLDKRLYQKIKEGDAEAVKIIAQGLTKGSTNEFSFASKWCFFHNETAFPMKDTRVMGSLKYYKKLVKNKKDMSQKHPWVEKLKTLEDEFDYVVFKKEVIDQFIKAFNLDVSYKQLDWYLWTFGLAIGVGKKGEDRKKRENKIRKDTDVILSLQE